MTEGFRRSFCSVLCVVKLQYRLTVSWNVASLRVQLKAFTVIRVYLSFNVSRCNGALFALPNRVLFVPMFVRLKNSGFREKSRSGTLCSTIVVFNNWKCTIHIVVRLACLVCFIYANVQPIVKSHNWFQTNTYFINNLVTKLNSKKFVTITFYVFFFFNKKVSMFLSSILYESEFI